MKITPGQWKYYSEYSAVCVIENHSLVPIADFGKISGHEANAKAIAALPELLAKLQVIAAQIDRSSGQPVFSAEEHNSIEVLIEKAIGESE